MIRAFCEDFALCMREYLRMRAFAGLFVYIMIQILHTSDDQKGGSDQSFISSIL